MNHEDHGTTCRETALITVSPFSPPVWSLVVPRIPHFPHSSQLAFLQNNGTAPHPNPITSRSSASCTLVQYVYSLGASHRQSLGCFRRSNHSPHSPLISFPSVQERMPAVVISSTSRLRHFKSFLVQFSITWYYCYFQGRVPISTYFLSFFFALCFSLFLNPC